MIAPGRRRWTQRPVLNQGAIGCSYPQQTDCKVSRTAGTHHRMPPLPLMPARWKCCPGSNTRCRRSRYKLDRLILSSWQASVVPHQSMGDTARNAETQSV